MTDWIIRGGDTKLQNSEKRGEATTGEICDGVSVFLLKTKETKTDPFAKDVFKCIGKTNWKNVRVYKEKHFSPILKNIPKTWKGKKGIVKKEPPKNHCELYGFLVSDVQAIFKSKGQKVDKPKDKG